MDCRHRKAADLLSSQIKHDALICARTRGIPTQETDDFLVWCVEYLLVLHSEEARRYLQGEHTRGWLRAVVDHRAVEWLRNSRRRRLYEVSWPENSNEEGYSQVWEAIDTQTSPEQACLCADVSEMLADIVSQMTPCQQDLYHRRILKGETLEAIAASQGKTANAVRQQLCQMRRQIISRLQRRGETYESLREAVSPPPPHLTMPA